MANTNNTLTNREALNLAAEFLAANSADETLIEKIQHMAETANARAERAKNAPKVPSKETREREQVAKEAIAGMPSVFTGIDLVEAGYVPTRSGATGLLRTAKRLGLVTTADKIKLANGNFAQSYKKVA